MAIYAGIMVIVLMSILALPVAGLFATSDVVAIVLGLALQSTPANVFPRQSQLRCLYVRGLVCAQLTARS